MYRSILVLLDGSPESEHALPLASSIANRAHAALRLVHVHTAASAHPIYVDGLAVIDEDLHPLGRDHERVYLQRHCDRLTTDRDLPVTPVNLEGDGSIAATLAAYAAASSVDLIVMTTHGRSGLARAWLGSVADSLIRQSSVPLLLVRPETASPTSDDPGAFEHILVPLDGSALAEQILDPARALGMTTQATYTLLHVVNPYLVVNDYPLAIAPKNGADEGAAVVQCRCEAAERYLGSMVARLRAEGLRVETRIVVSAHPAVVILEAAQEQPGTLIALATHGRGGLARLVLGSVADKVVRGATCPVLVVRPQEHS